MGCVRERVGVYMCVLCRTQEGGSDRVNDPAFPVTTLLPRRRDAAAQTVYVRSVATAAEQWQLLF